MSGFCVSFFFIISVLEIVSETDKSLSFFTQESRFSKAIFLSAFVYSNQGAQSYLKLRSKPV